MLDISLMKETSLGKRNVWILIEDQASKMKWSLFTWGESATWWM
jgi:hypothetical protein